MDFFNIHVKLFNALNGGQVIESKKIFVRFIFLKVDFKDKIKNPRYWGKNISGGWGEGEVSLDKKALCIYLGS